jgi:membrane peptidoglycan carboxypeptidase
MTFQYDDQDTVQHQVQPVQPTEPTPAYHPGYYPPPPPYTIPPPEKRRRRAFPGGCLGCVALIVGLFFAFSCVCGATSLFILNYWTGQLDQKLDAAQKTIATTTFQTAKIYDRSGNLLHELFPEGKRTNIKLANAPKFIIDATISTEDKTFWDNPGIDIQGISRAGIGLLLTDDGVGGGSTITQQLVRAIVFDYKYRNERSLRRKLEEIGLALLLTRQSSKEEILELYLNQIYYGNLAYGIEAAAQTYFGKAAAQLTLAEASLLAGLPQAPAELDPLNPDPKIQAKVAERHKIVLDAMVTNGKITRAEADAARAVPLTFIDSRTAKLVSPHFTLYAEDELKQLIAGLNLPPETLLTGGLSVYTTLDSRAQAIAEQAAKTQIAAISAKNNARNAAVVVLKPGTGEILAMMGSIDYYDEANKGKVNVAISQQQPGSAIKPLTYAASLEKGDTAATIYWDTQQQIGLPGQAPYIPKNYDGRFHGVVRMREALANSYNIPAVQALRRIGVESLLNIAERFGVRSFGNDASRYGLSLTLGGGELTPLELTQAYAVFANGGNFVPVTSLLCVVDSAGNIVYQYERSCPRGNVTDTTISTGAPQRQVIDPRAAYIISDILADNAARSAAMGPRSPLYTKDIPTSVKTGTTNDYRDNWTMGYTRNLVVGVWVGNTDNTPMINSSGLTGAAPIWNAVITGIYNDVGLQETLKRNGQLMPDGQTPPQGMSRKQICNAAALRDPAPNCTPGRVEWFIDGAPLVPDGSGKLVSGVNVVATSPARNGPRLADVDVDIVQALVQPIDPNSIVMPVTGSGRLAPPPPNYCLVPQEVADQVPGAAQQVFIKPPRFEDEDVFARRYAQGAGIPILPNVACTPELLAAAANPAAAGVTARITSPQAGDSVTGTVIVGGTVAFTSEQATYFKVEIQGPQFPDWTTIGNTHNNSVINGQLETFGATGLSPGTYQLRIVVVGLDGNYLMTTPPVPVNVSGA